MNDTRVQPQGAGPSGPPSATDPMSTSLINRFSTGGRAGIPNGFITTPEVKPLRAGDRILVQKYLYELFPPERWDVVVFKNPESATQNFIKRLVGLPNEQVWLADGDVF
ncbi:MAG TPA: signal peptidase I, partial [Phycisphaerales bacterium]|nr:signal peptidase I [Phycisphaerales bacterium]